MQEQVTLLRLALLLRAQRDGWERDPLLPAEPAQELQLLQGGQKQRQRDRPTGPPSVLDSGLTECGGLLGHTGLSAQRPDQTLVDPTQPGQT